MEKACHFVSNMASFVNFWTSKENCLSIGDFRAGIGKSVVLQVISAVEEKKKWVDEQRARQEKRKKTEPPVVFVYQIKEEQQVCFLLVL